MENSWRESHLIRRAELVHRFTNLDFQKAPLRWLIQSVKVLKFEALPGPTVQRFSVSFPGNPNLEAVLNFLFYCEPTELVLFQGCCQVGSKVQLVDRSSYSVYFRRKLPRMMEVTFGLEPISKFLFLRGFIEFATVSDARTTFAGLMDLKRPELLCFRRDTGEILGPQTALNKLKCKSFESFLS
jgi:hypothetical protein